MKKVLECILNATALLVLYAVVQSLLCEINGCILPEISLMHFNNISAIEDGDLKPFELI